MATPLGIGLIRYAAQGGEPKRASSHYISPLNVPANNTYAAGETVEVLLDAGYSALGYNDHDHIISGKVRQASNLNRLTGTQRTHTLRFQFVTDEPTLSELAALEAMQDAGMRGSILFWYPDFTNYPTEYFACAVTKRHDPQRTGVTFDYTLELTEIQTATVPEQYYPSYFSTYALRPTGLQINSTPFTITNTSSNTLATWVKFLSVPTYNNKLLWDLGNAAYLLWRPSDQKIELNFYVNGSYYQAITSTAYDLTGWTHIGYTIDATNGTATIYCRQQAVATQTFPATTLWSGQYFSTPIISPADGGTISLFDDIYIAHAVMFNGTIPDFTVLGRSPVFNPSAQSGVMWWHSFDNTLGGGSTLDGSSLGFTMSYVTDVPT